MEDDLAVGEPAGGGPGRLRAESIGSVKGVAGGLQIQFTRADGYLYAVQVSSNLVDWAGLSTNQPSNGAFHWQEPSGLGASPRFYRSRLLP